MALSKYLGINRCLIHKIALQTCNTFGNRLSLVPLTSSNDGGPLRVK